MRSREREYIALVNVLEDEVRALREDRDPREEEYARRGRAHHAEVWQSLLRNVDVLREEVTGACAARSATRWRTPSRTTRGGRARSGNCWGRQSSSRRHGSKRIARWPRPRASPAAAKGSRTTSMTEHASVPTWKNTSGNASRTLKIVADLLFRQLPPVRLMRP